MSRSESRSCRGGGQRQILAAVLLAVLFGCESDDGLPVSPTGGSTTTYAPSSIIGQTVIFTIRERFTDCTASPGTVIRYFFESPSRIRGVRPDGVFDAPSRSWRYSQTGRRTGVINITWINGSRSEIDLTFTSETRGTFEQMDHAEPGGRYCGSAPALPRRLLDRVRRAAGHGIASDGMDDHGQLQRRQRDPLPVLPQRERPNTPHVAFNQSGLRRAGIR